MNKKILVPFFALVITLSFSSVALAQEKNPTPNTESNPSKTLIENPFKGGNSLNELMKTIVNEILLPIASILAVLSFIYSGFIYVMARGNENEIKRAHRALLYSAIGTALLLGAWSIVNVLTNTVDKLKV